MSADRIRYLKRIGDEITHYNINKLTVPMIHWQIALLEDADYADALLAKENFIRALHTLGMVRTLGSDGIIHVK